MCDLLHRGITSSRPHEVDRLEREGRTCADELGDRAIFARLDVTSDRDWAATVAAAEDAFGPVSVLWTCPDFVDTWVKLLMLRDPTVARRPGG